MAARPARGNQHFAPRIQPALVRSKCFSLQRLAVQVQIERPPDGGRLLKNLAKHGMREFVHDVRTFPGRALRVVYGSILSPSMVVPLKRIADQSRRRRAHASARSASFLAKQKRSRSSPLPGRKKADPATAATPTFASSARAFSAAVSPGRLPVEAST